MTNRPSVTGRFVPPRQPPIHNVPVPLSPEQRAMVDAIKQAFRR